MRDPRGAPVIRRAGSGVPGRERELWRRELAAVVGLAGPAALTQIGLVLMGVVDTMMLGRYSAEAMAAASLGHSVSMSAIILGMGLLLAIEPLVAQPWGAGDRRRVRAHLQQALMLAAVLSLPIGLALLVIEPLFGVFGQQPEVSRLTASYVRIIGLGVAPFLMFVALRQGLQAMDVVRPALIAIALANVVNAAANWVLIFGHLGVPAMGVAGSAWATSMARLSMPLLLVWLARGTLRPLRLWRRWPAPRLDRFRLFFRIGVPIAVHAGVEFWMVTGIALMMGSLGAAELAGHQVALVLAALAYMVALGISGAAAARVGQAVGAGDAERMRVACRVSLGLSVAVMSVSAALFLGLPAGLARLFTDEAEVIAVASALLPIAALFQVFDGLQVVATGALRGAADTRVPATIAVLGYWVLCLPLAGVLTYGYGLGVRGPWWGLAAGLGVTAALLVQRALRMLARPVQAV